MVIGYPVSSTLESKGQSFIFDTLRPLTVDKTSLWLRVYINENMWTTVDDSVNFPS